MHQQRTHTCHPSTSAPKTPAGTVQAIVLHQGEALHDVGCVPPDPDPVAAVEDHIGFCSTGRSI